MSAAPSDPQRSHLVPSRRVNFEEVMSHLGARSDVPSTLGSQLEGARGRSIPDGALKRIRKAAKAMTREEREHAFWSTMPVHEDTDGKRRDEEARVESRLFNRARVIACVDALGRYHRVSFVMCPAVEKYAASTRMAQGAVVVAVLRCFEEWRLQSPERGLAEVYTWLRDHGPKDEAGSPVWVMPEHDEDSLAQAFRTRKAKVCQRRADEMVADATIVMGAWVELWNRKVTRAESNEAM